jgi:hypothetical protein
MQHHTMRYRSLSLKPYRYLYTNTKVEKVARLRNAVHHAAWYHKQKNTPSLKEQEKAKVVGESHQQKNLYTFFHFGHFFFSSRSSSISAWMLSSRIPVTRSMLWDRTTDVRNQNLYGK